MKILITNILSILIPICQLYAYDIISFDDYKQEAQETYNINQKEIINQILNLKNVDCMTEKNDDGSYTVSASCILNNKLPQIDYKEAIDYLREYIEGFGTIYNDNESSFSYEGTFPIFKEDLDLFPYSLAKKAVLIEKHKKNQKIIIDKKYIAYKSIENIGFYVTKKDLSILKKCTKQNYTVAIESFNGTILKPNESINLNKHLSYLPGYCKGSGPQNLMFYGGVCGFVTQLFRTSILLPEIEITKRYPHSVRLSAYYSDYIFGDDAAVYEMGKQFEIKNNSEYPIYFKQLNNGNFNYFVAILLGTPTQGVNITKEQIEKNQGKIRIKTYNLDTKKDIITKVFNSKYDYISDARR